MKITRSLFAFILVVNILILGLIFSSYRLRTISSVGSETLSINDEPVVNQEVKTQINEVFAEIYSNKLKYNQEALGTARYQRTFEDLFPNSSIQVTTSLDVIKYTPNLKIEEGYEGLRWTRNVGDDVKQVLSLNDGTQIVESNIGGIERASYIAYTNKIYPSRYAYYDSFFPPARSNDHRFVIIDEINKQLIELTVSLQEGSSGKKVEVNSQEVCYQSKCTYIYIYSGEAQKIIDQVEYIIQDNLPKGAR